MKRTYINPEINLFTVELTPLMEPSVGMSSYSQNNSDALGKEQTFYGWEDEDINEEETKLQLRSLFDE